MDVDTDAAIRHIEMTDTSGPVGMMNQTEQVNHLDCDRPGEPSISLNSSK